MDWGRIAFDLILLAACVFCLARSGPGAEHVD